MRNRPRFKQIFKHIELFIYLFSHVYLLFNFPQFEIYRILHCVNEAQWMLKLWILLINLTRL